MSLHTRIPLPFFCVCVIIYSFFSILLISNARCFFIQLDAQQIVLGTRIALLLTDVAYAVQVLHEMQLRKFYTIKLTFRWRILIIRMPPPFFTNWSFILVSKHQIICCPLRTILKFCCKLSAAFWKMLMLVTGFFPNCLCVYKSSSPRCNLSEVKMYCNNLKLFSHLLSVELFYYMCELVTMKKFLLF